MMHLNIEDYNDPINGHVIPLGMMSRDDVFKKLLGAGIDLETADAYASQAWFCALEKFTCAPLMPSEVYAALQKLDYPRSVIREHIHSTFYDQLLIAFPSHYPACTLRFLTDMLSEEAILMFEAASVLTLHSLAEELKPGTPQVSNWSLDFSFKDSKSVMLQKLKFIFAKLQQLSTDNEMINAYQAAHIQCKQFIAKFLKDRRKGFVNGNYAIRHIQPKEVSTQLQKSPQKTRELYLAIRRHNVTQVEKLLTEGVNPKIKYTPFSLLEEAIPGYQEKVDTQSVLRIFALLLEYGAPIDAGMTFGSALATLIQRAFECDLATEYGMFEEMIRMVMFLDNGRTHSRLPKKLTHPLVNLIARGQDALANKAYQRAEMRCLTARESRFADIWMMQPRMQSFVWKNTTLRTLTLPIHQALGIEHERIYQLFAKTWTSVDKASLKKSFSEIIDMVGYGFAELVYEDQNLLGVNIVEFLRTTLAGKIILIHHPKLTMLSPDISKNCSGFAFYLLHHRGFLALTQGLPVPTVTIFETATFAGMSLALAFTHYPRTQTPELKNYVEAIRRIVYARCLHKLFKLNDRWYIEDVLANFDNYAEKKWHASRASIGLKNQIKTHGFFRSGLSNILCYVNNEENHKILNDNLAQSFHMYSNEQEKQLVCRI